MFKKVNEYIDNEIIKNKGVQYFDAIVYQGHE